MTISSARKIRSICSITVALSAIPVSSSWAAENDMEFTYVTVKEHLFRQFWHSRIDSTFGNHGSPVASADGKIVVIGTASGKLRCLNESGAILWKNDQSRAIGATGIIAQVNINGTVRDLFLIGTLEGTFEALDLKDGSFVWETESQGGAVLAKPYLSVENGQKFVYFTTEQNKIFKLDAATGEKLWSYAHKGVVQEMTVRGHTPVVSLDELNNVYYGTSDGYLLALTKKAGLVSFQTFLSKKDSAGRFTDVDATPVFGGTKESRLIYAASYNGGLFAINAQNGNIIWNHDNYMVSSIINTGDSLVIAQPTGTISGLDSMGFTKWEAHFKTSQTGVFTYLPEEHAAILPTAIDGIMIFDTESGRPIQTINIGGEFSPELAVAGDHLYFMTNQGSLYNFNLIP